ncbi:MAG TPA: hypothetical protein VMX16_05920 [Terriglobia bacterium]|nr:hypothetical protein [Terriglobia bacterium]
MNEPDPTASKTEIPNPATPERLDTASVPDEPFPCPNCGQMLGPSVRICAACHESVDISKINVTTSVADQPLTQFTPAASASVEPARFSWRIFVVVLVVWLLAAYAGQRFLNPLHEQFFLAGIVCATSIWVFYDARARNVPHPFRWSIACILFWIVFFPWYLARRKTPAAPCPVMDQGARRLLWWLIPILVFLLLFSMIVALLHGLKK